MLKAHEYYSDYSFDDLQLHLDAVDFFYESEKNIECRKYLLDCKIEILVAIKMH